MDSKTLLSKEYDAESLCDVERDVYEAFAYGVMDDIPMADDSFQRGTFTVEIVWKDDE